MTGPPIKSVAAQADHILRVNWSSGSATLLNMKPKLSSPRFSPPCGRRRCGAPSPQTATPSAGRTKRATPMIWRSTKSTNLPTAFEADNKEEEI